MRSIVRWLCGLSDTLITVDTEALQRAKDSAVVATPGEWLSRRATEQP